MRHPLALPNTQINNAFKAKLKSIKTKLIKIKFNINIKLKIKIKRRQAGNNYLLLQPRRRAQLI